MQATGTIIEKSDYFAASVPLLFSPHKTEQSVYGRFINTHGRIGCLEHLNRHQEHLNRRLKRILRNLQSNIQTTTITRAANSIGIVQEICDQFDKETSSKKGSDKQMVPSSKKINH